MALTLYNTLTRKKETFEPLVDGQVKVYVCGPTVYGHSHVGHAKSYVSFDIIVRYLRYLGYNTLYVQNITDVGHLTDDADEGEDKIQRQSAKDRVHPMQIVEAYTRSYFEDMDAMGVLRPDISPRATGHMIEQIEIVKQLIKRGYAYEKNGSVYFNIKKFDGYGKLSRRPMEEMEAGARVEVNKDKKNPADFALWKKAEPEHIMQWDSPWGMGFPGWHLECSAMSMKYLGETFDIHGGGLENQFPHHECEIAQSECLTGKPFVKYWIHNNMVTVGGQKMGKSLGNMVNLKEAFKKYSPLIVRFFILQSHYRSTLDFTAEAVEGAAKGLEKLLNTVRNLRGEIEKLKNSGAKDTQSEPFLDAEGFRKGFLEAMDDDFNTPQAIGVLFDLNKEVNTILAAGKNTLDSLLKLESLYDELGGRVLGIIPGHGRQEASAVSIEGDLVQFIIELRAEVRGQKLWALSDKIRDGLKAIGIVIEDRKDGTIWRRV